ncbi:uncharacterized protein LOC125664646 [Ostrea edulis]|uniref:uncharacterized protein LOC125664646 n=1 Tax=Ostrea edulis TaxID=37623 RepID=UPI0024AF9763|nr:uncharacterized protein LOC125664646 [Ostrea edulis]
MYFYTDLTFFVANWLLNNATFHNYLTICCKMCIVTGTMPPKPSQRLSAKRRRVNSPGSSEAPNFTCASDSVRNDPNPIQSSSSGVNTLASQINYAELAKHIVAQQRQQGTEIQQEASAQPQTMTDSTPVSSSMLNGSEGNQDVSASNLSSLLDNVFTGGSSSGATPGHTTNDGSSTAVANLSSVTQTILRASLSVSTRVAYKHSWELYRAMSPNIVSLPLPLQSICNFIGYLFEKQYNASSIASHISALSYVHKLLDVKDPTQSFIVKKLLRGCHKLNPSKDSRLPVTKEILCKLLNATDFTVPQALNKLLLKALYLLSFNAFLRLGEVVIKSPSDCIKVIQVQDVSFQMKGKDPLSLQIAIHHHKSQKNSDPVIITIQSNPHSAHCPVLSLYRYKSSFPHTSGPLFQFTSGVPVPYSYVCGQLSKAAIFAGLDPRRYKGHSFRIGAATHAAQLGFSENYIQHLGRWNSNVLHRYIRIQSFKL